MTYFKRQLAKAEAKRNAEAIQRVRELHKPGREKEWEMIGTTETITEIVTVCSWCQYLIDDDYYSRRIAPYPCPTIKALDGEQA